MKTLGNIIWFIFGGFLSALIFSIYGIVLSITIIGLPLAIQCFKMAKLSLAPFGKEIIWSANPASLIINIFGVIFVGIETAILHIVIGIALCCTIIGIPFGLQFFKIAKLSFLPFGAEIIRT